MTANTTLFNPNASWLAISGYALANIVKVGLGIGLVRRVLGRTPRFARRNDCVAFVIGVARCGHSTRGLKGRQVQSAFDRLDGSLPTRTAFKPVH